MDWIYDDPFNVNQNVWLVAHNGFRFDGPILVSHLLRYNIVSCNQLSRIVSGFGDSLQSFRRYFGLRGNSLHDWIQRFNIAEDQTHNAIHDARHLKQIVKLGAREQNMTVGRFINYRKSIQQIIEEDLQ